MQNKLLAFIRQYGLLQPGDAVVCAVSGGADSIALLYALHLLKEKLQISVSAAHFNHGLRGAESDSDEIFVRNFCDRYEIPLVVGTGSVVAGKKGLEASARTARYDFLRSLPGKIATAHTADDNAETVLMHLVRGTGLNGLGGIMPCNGNVIRPLLGATRAEVLAFLEEHHLRYVEDASNQSDVFFRNRLRHHVMPLLREENPRLAESVSEMALRLRRDEEILAQLAEEQLTTDVSGLRALPDGIRTRVLNLLLQQWGVSEPEAEHVALVDKLVFSEKPSACAYFPGNICIARNYGCLEKREREITISQTELPCPGVLELPELGLRFLCSPAEQICNDRNCFTVQPTGRIFVRSRQSGDKLRCPG
ncbi:MAG: tRNA lysidine(34) synthetase TilS, partial [Oscillospiraceae bacterium]|nr:tRNA lysidine(34) synthetase TilS [Oscillospiraceae bacterium]